MADEYAQAGAATAAFVPSQRRTGGKRGMRTGTQLISKGNATLEQEEEEGLTQFAYSYLSLRHPPTGDVVKANYVTSLRRQQNSQQQTHNFLP